ncbi:MAG: FtsX-like permease family protein, partial [Pseudomonadota bacterium]
LRQALANLHRPGAATPDVILALGVGLTVLAAIAQIETNLAEEVERGIPDQAPSFYFIDIQTDQREAFIDLVGGIPGAETPDTTPMIRGRITAIKGVPSAEAVVDKEVSWAVRGDRGLTYEYDLPDNQAIVRSAWWPRDYDGPPLVSMTEEMAVGFGMEIGDTVTLNVLGRNITATLAATREVDWGGLQQNFTFMFAPGVLERAPHGHIATVKTTEAAEPAVFESVTETFPNVSVVPVREALTVVTDISEKLAAAVRLTAGVTLVAGVLVLAGAIAAGHRRRVYEAVVMKVLGATRGDMLRSHLTEFGALGLVTAVIAAGIGVAAGWAVVEHVLFIDFSLALGPVVA